LSFSCITRQQNISDLLCLDLFSLIEQLVIELNIHQLVEAGGCKPISLLRVYLQIKERAFSVMQLNYNAAEMFIIDRY
jgi:hypothetical protein